MLITSPKLPQDESSHDPSDDCSSQKVDTMKYEIIFHADKEVSNWDSENGASGESRSIDSWSATIQSNAKPTRKDFADFVYDRYSLKANQFRHWPDEPGRFTLSRVENGNGEEDPNGRFLADCDVRVICHPIANEVSVGTFGLKSVDQ